MHKAIVGESSCNYDAQVLSKIDTIWDFTLHNSSPACNYFNQLLPASQLRISKYLHIIRKVSKYYIGTTFTCITEHVK